MGLKFFNLRPAFIVTPDHRVIRFRTRWALRSKQAAIHEYSFMNSAARSPIIMQVRLVLAWATVGMIEASPTERLSIPCTRKRWSSTAVGTEAGDILPVHDQGKEVVIV